MMGLQETAQFAKRAMRALAGHDLLISAQMECEKVLLGAKGARWCICPTGLSAASVVYSFGVGEELSFERALISRFGLRVHAFDPTPRSIEWAGKQVLPKELNFHPCGVADFDGTCRFSPPVNREHVSHTILDRETPWPAIEVPVQRVMSIMKSLDHKRIDLLKMDIEGAEYMVLADLLASRIRMGQLLVEFHHRWSEIGIEKTRKTIRELNAAGYRIFSISPSGEEYGFQQTLSG